MSLAAVAGCLYSPALPSMAVSVGRSITALQFLVVANLCGQILGPLFYAVLANRFGRLKSIKVGLGLAMLGALLCALVGWSHSYRQLLVGGFLLTFGANVGLTLVLTMIRDRERPQQLQSTNALVLLSFAILPGAAVMLGSAIVTYYAWPWLFVLLMGYCVVLYLGLSLLPESPRTPHLFSLAMLSKGYFWWASVVAACVSGCFYSFNAQAPRIALHVLPIGVIPFGWLSNLPSLGMLIGSMAAIVLAKRGAAIDNGRLGLCLAWIMAGVMLISFVSVKPDTWWVFAFTALVNVGLQILFPAVVTIALAKSDNPASAASCLSVIHSGGAAIWVVLGNLWPSTSYLSLPGMYCLILSAAGVCLWRIKGGSRN